MNEPQIKETWRRPGPGNGRRADKTRADELPKNERDPVDAPEIARNRLAQRIGDRSAERDRRGPGQHLRRRPERNEDPNEADQDGDPAKTLDLFAKQRRGQRSDDERRRHVKVMTSASGI
jgi:hypothetical protein